VTVIGEVKRRSPSAGAIAPDLDPAALAAAYSAGGARAISVLTNDTFFGGSLADLESVRDVVDLPLIRKDFLVDPVQIYEARAVGASAVLLIVRALEREQLEDLYRLACELGLATLVEVHTEKELDEALRIDARFVGVNSRDLTTFQVDIERIAEVIRSIPQEITAVAESGIGSRADVKRVAQWGADAVLVGTTLARSARPAEAVKQLTGVARRGRD
jgi:indole-3-glycerol phosphate synthase